MTINSILFIFECIMWLSGFILIIMQDWRIGLGVYLVLWANNLEWRRKTEIHDNS